MKEEKNKINGSTLVWGVIGNPIKHTMSPQLHNYIASITRINGAYLPFHVTNDLSSAVLGAFKLGIQGLNVTLPYKLSVMEHLIDIDEEAKVIGAVNTLCRVENGYKGYNTDMEGLYRGMLRDGIRLQNKQVIILGAGGAGRATAYLAGREGANHIYIINRTLDKAAQIAEDMNKHFQTNKFSALTLGQLSALPNEAFTVFQTTSVGLAPHSDEVLIHDEEFYKKVHIGIDLIYKPSETKFMKLVENAGGKSYNGLKMLMYQGIIAFELWNGIQINPATEDKIYQMFSQLAVGGDNQ